MKTLSLPIVPYNLTASFILAPVLQSQAADRDYAVLEKAIESQTARAFETGKVNELLIERTGHVDLFMQAGDILKGGRQDRVIGVDCIVPARSGEIRLPPFCVEKSRRHRRHSESVAAPFAGAKQSRMRSSRQLTYERDGMTQAIAQQKRRETLTTRAL